MSIKYTEENGLPTNHIYQVEQDAAGFIWFATNSGVVKFDGNKFKTFTTQEGLPTNDIWRIEATRDGKIWFFAKSKNLGYIIKDKVYSFPIEGGEAVQPSNWGIANSNVYFTSKSSTNARVYRLNGKIWQAAHSTDYNSRLNSNSDFLIFLMDGKKIHSLNNECKLIDNQGFKLFSFKKVGPSNLEEMHYTKIPSKQVYFERDSIYCLVNKIGVMIYNLNDSTLRINALFKDGSKSPVTIPLPEIQECGNFYQISSGNEWYLVDKYLNLIDQISFNTETYPVHIFKDNFGNFWIADHENGVRTHSNALSSQKKYFNKKKIQALFIENEIVFLNVLNEGWYYRTLDMVNFELLIPTIGKAYDMGFHEATETFYFTSGAYLYFGKNLNNIQSIEKHGFVHSGKITFEYAGAKCIIETPNGFTGANVFGIFKLDHNFKLLNPEYRPNDPRFIRGINAISQFGNRVFLGGDGLYELINDSVAVIKHKHSIVQAPIKTMFVHHNLLFIGTDGFGAYTYDSLNNIKFIKGTEGLSVNKIVSYKNLIWMATWKGLRYFKTNRSGEEYMLKGSVFDEDGLLSNRVNSMAVLDEELYLAFDNGLSVFKYSPELYKRPFKTYLADASNYNEITNTISASYGDAVSLSFGVLAFPSQKYVKYYYKTNKDNSFTQTDNPSITFAEIEPGNYTVSFVAFDQHGNYGKSEVYLQILPAWYQTWWIKVIVGILLLVIIISITLFIRRNKEKKIEKDLLLKKALAELELKALRSQMNPHFVFNSLNAIQYFIVKNKRELSEEYLAKFSQLVRLFFEYSKYEQLSIAKEVDLLERYLEIEKIRFEDKLEYSITVDDRIDTDEMAVPSMILQPIVENAVNHGIFHKLGNGKVELRFDFVDESTIKVSVSDDGVGIEAMKQIQKKSLGTYRSKSSEVIKERLKILSENKLSPWYVHYSITDLSVLDNEKSGTLVEIVIIYK